MDEVELINALTTIVSQVTQRPIIYVRPTNYVTPDVGVEGGASNHKRPTSPHCYPC